MLIAKSLLISLLRKKARTILLLFSIAACASLLFANIAFQKTCGQMVYDAATHWCGNSDLYVSPRQAAGSEEWMDPDLLAKYRDRLEYDYSLIRSKALYAPGSEGMHTFTVLGTDLNEFAGYNQLAQKEGSIIDNKSSDGWSGYKLIIGDAYAKKMGVGLNDTLSLEINGGAYEFVVAGISAPKGLFLRDLADGGYLLMPKETVSEITGGQCNLIFLKIRDSYSAPELVPELKEELTSAFPQYTINLGIDPAIIQLETNGYVMPFWFSSIFVIFMSIFIIYTSFNLIVNERIGTLGILRSVGCTRRRTGRILVTESIIIGAAGGAVGSVFGTGFLYIIKDVYFSGDYAVVDAPVLFGAREVLITMGAAALITAFTAMLPILKATKQPIKNIILNDINRPKLKESRMWPLGLALFVPCFLIPGMFGKGMPGMITSTAAASLALIGLILVMPQVCRLAAIALRRVSFVVALGVRNTGDYKALVNNARLFATVIATMIFMMTLFNTLATDMRNTYQRERYDISVELRESGPGELARLAETEGVLGFCGAYETYAEIRNYGAFMNGLFGIDSLDFFEYSQAYVPQETYAALRSLNDGRNIVTTNIMREKLGLKIGDTLSLKMDNGIADYKVTGFLDSNYGLGYIGFISSENYRADMGVRNYSKILIKADGNPDEVKNNIQRALLHDVLSAQTKAELEAANADKVEAIFNAINTYAWFAMLIGILGIINNMIACFMSRQRGIALYRCIGMSAKDTGRLLMTEAAAIGIIGALTGGATGIIMMQAIPYVVGMLWGYVAVVAPLIQLILLCVCSISAMLLCSLIPAAKGRNIMIMDNIRYE